MERTLIYGILLFASIYVLNLNISKIGSKSIFFKLAIFFGILTLLFLAIGGINSDFQKVPIITFFCTLGLLSANLLMFLASIFKGKLELLMGLLVLGIIICEMSLKLDPYSRVFRLIFNTPIDVKNIQLLCIVGFVVVLSIKIFSALFFKKDLSILNPSKFKVKDGKSK